MSPRRSEALAAFLTELSDLTKKYGFVISGEFGQPAVISGNRETVDLSYNYEKERYDAF
ncbi:hypothetical protein AB0M00_31105 [Streptomyces chartreusis]|uniref:hypothetical protein n=1 Tax=Streptomyces chartreusis TaxID=1969 RepID=UPI00343C6334